MKSIYTVEDIAKYYKKQIDTVYKHSQRGNFPTAKKFKGILIWDAIPPWPNDRRKKH